VYPAVLHDLTSRGDAPRLLDVRTTSEFQSFHIPGSYNVPLDTLREHRDELRQHLDQDVVLICLAGGRAAQAEQALAEAGLPNLRVLQGGIAAWEAAGLPVTRGPARWDLERQVRLVAGSMVLAAGVVDLAVPGLQWVATAVGAGLAFAAITNSCAMGTVLSKLPYNRGPRVDIHAVLSALGDRP
jgi:rhodanese-related sulfurtransferase